MEELKQYFKHILKYYPLSDKQTLEENVNNLFTEIDQALQLQQTGVSGRSEQLVCGCGSDDIYIEPKVYNCQDCGKSWK